jgi:putative membrane protein
MRNTVLRWVINTVAVYVAIRLVPGIGAEGSLGTLAGVALIMGLVNTFVKPVITILSCPLMLLTLGLFTLIVNGLMLGLTSTLAGGLGLSFHVEGFGAALFGSIVISVVSFVLSLLLIDDDDDGRRRQR